MTTLIPEVLWEGRAERHGFPYVHLSENGSRILVYDRGPEGELIVLDRNGNPLLRYVPRRFSNRAREEQNQTFGFRTLFPWFAKSSGQKGPKIKEGLFLDSADMSSQGDRLVVMVREPGEEGSSKGPATVYSFDLGFESLSGVLEPIAKYRLELPPDAEIRWPYVSKGGYTAISVIHHERGPNNWGSVYFLNPQGHLVWRHELRNPPGHVCVTPDGSFLAVVVSVPTADLNTSHCTAYVFDHVGRVVASPTFWRRGSSPLSLIPTSISISDDGSLVAVGGYWYHEDVYQPGAEVFCLIDEAGNRLWRYQTRTPITGFIPRVWISRGGKSVTGLITGKGIYRFDTNELRWKYEAKGLLGGAVVMDKHVLLAEVDREVTSLLLYRHYEQVLLAKAGRERCSLHLVLLNGHGEVAWKHTVVMPACRAISNLSFSADGRYVAVATWDPPAVLLLPGVPVCSKCGELNRHQARFCRRCGQGLWSEIAAGERDHACQMLQLRIQ